MGIPDETPNASASVLTPGDSPAEIRAGLLLACSSLRLPAPQRPSARILADAAPGNP